MSREFSLVLLGAGVLTAGYFVAPSGDEELERKADEQAAERVGADRTHHRSHGGMFLLVHTVHSPGYAGPRTGSPATPAVSRGGFGGAAKSFGATGG